MNGSWTNWKISPSPSEKNLPLKKTRLQSKVETLLMPVHSPTMRTKTSQDAVQWPQKKISLSDCWFNALREL